MVTCKLCGASGFLLQVDGLGLCGECEGIFATDLTQRYRTIEETQAALAAATDSETALELWRTIRQNARELLIYEEKGLPIKPAPSEIIRECTDTVNRLRIQLVKEKVERILARAEQAESNRAKAREACRAMGKLEQARLEIEGDTSALEELETRVKHFCNRTQFVPFLESAERAEAKGKKQKALELYRDAEYYLMKHPIDHATDSELLVYLDRKIKELEGSEKVIPPAPQMDIEAFELQSGKRAIALNYQRRIDPYELKKLFQHAWWAKDRRAADIKQMLENSTLVLSLWDENRLVGFTRVLSDKVFRATIWDMVIDPEYRGHGLENRLMEAILTHPELARIEAFILYSADHQDFFARFGFKISERSMVLTRDPDLDMVTKHGHRREVASGEAEET